MAYEPRDLSGILGRNDRATSDKHPGYKGSALIDGADFWISGWVRTKTADGSRFFSLAFEPKVRDETPEQRASAVLGRAYGLDPADVLARLGDGSAGPQGAPVGGTEGGWGGKSGQSFDYGGDIPF